VENPGAEAAVAQAVEAYRHALLTADAVQLDALCMDELTYGHSSGAIQTKAEFLAEATSGKTVWKSLRFEDPSNRVVDDCAISRYVFTGENESEGRSNALRFGVVMVWQRQRGHWKLLVRQGYKL